MPRPMYDAKGERILYVDDDAPGKPGDPPKTVLVSVKEDGTDRRVHLRWSHGEEAVVSPDGRFVGYNELHDAWAAMSTARYVFRYKVPLPISKSPMAVTVPAPFAPSH